jgi:hypothetical protein
MIGWQAGSRLPTLTGHHKSPLLYPEQGFKSGVPTFKLGTHAAHWKPILQYRVPVSAWATGRCWPWHQTVEGSNPSSYYRCEDAMCSMASACSNAWPCYDSRYYFMKIPSWVPSFCTSQPWDRFGHISTYTGLGTKTPGLTSKVLGVFFIKTASKQPLFRAR